MNYPANATDADVARAAGDSPTTLQELIAELKESRIIDYAGAAAESAQDLCEIETPTPDPSAVDDKDKTHGYTAIRIKPLVAGDDSREAVELAIATACQEIVNTIHRRLGAEIEARLPHPANRRAT